MANAHAEVPRWTLGNRMWKARTVAGLEQAEVAKLVGVSRALVSRWERDLSDPGYLQLRAFAEVTNAPWGWLTEDGAFGYRSDDPDRTSGKKRNDAGHLGVLEGGGKAPKHNPRPLAMSVS